MIPSDPYYAQQWHFLLLGRIQTIWDEFDGSGVHVGVFDDGIEVTHADLKLNYDASRHFVHDGITYLPTPRGPDEGHGTSVAGLIAATDGNGTGGVGMAHGASITGVNIYDPRLDVGSGLEEAVIRWGAQFDIMSNSWNWFPGFEAFQDIGDEGSFHQRYEAAYGWIAETGRGGLGTVIVQSAGNDTLDANGSGINVSRFTITVAATDQDNRIEDYSNYGTTILVSAPAATVTTDLSGNDGYNFAGSGDPLLRNYTSDFGGTSASAPVVSGIVALMLDAAPGLGWRDVQTILALSASGTGDGYPQGHGGWGWMFTGADDWNGGGRAYSSYVGYGIVDAFAAVRMAEAWSRMSGPAQVSANEISLSAEYDGPPVEVPDYVWPSAASAAGSVTVTTDIEVESIYVTVQFGAHYLDGYDLALRAPDGTEVNIWLGHFDFDDSYYPGFEYTFGVESFRGYSSVGTWQLVAYDTQEFYTGTLVDFDLTFHGRAADTNDIHSFTDDFLALAALDEDRRTFGDSNGGTDWLNFAGVSGAMLGRLDMGGEIFIDGVLWGTLGDNNIENVHLGDGNDTVLGSRGDSVMIGGRGNDKLNGFRGNDRVEGGLGNDRLTGGVGNDTVDGGLGVDQLTGGTGADTFVFGAGYRRDWIFDFVDNEDTLQFSHNLWRGNLTVAQVVTNFASVVGTNIVFDFGVHELTVAFAVAPDTSIFLDDIVIV